VHSTAAEVGGGRVQPGRPRRPILPTSHRSGRYHARSDLSGVINTRRAQKPGSAADLLSYVPKGTGLSRWSADDTEAVAATLNSRRRKTLGWKTPAGALNEQQTSIEQAGVASTG